MPGRSDPLVRSCASPVPPRAARSRQPRRNAGFRAPGGALRPATCRPILRKLSCKLSWDRAPGGKRQRTLSLLRARRGSIDWCRDGVAGASRPAPVWCPRFRGVPPPPLWHATFRFWHPALDAPSHPSPPQWSSTWSPRCMSEERADRRPSSGTRCSRSPRRRAATSPCLPASCRPDACTAVSRRAATAVRSRDLLPAGRRVPRHHATRPRYHRAIFSLSSRYLAYQSGPQRRDCVPHATFDTLRILLANPLRPRTNVENWSA